MLAADPGRDAYLGEKFKQPMRLRRPNGSNRLLSAHFGGIVETGTFGIHLRGVPGLTSRSASEYITAG
jgi:hypothetical protein